MRQHGLLWLVLILLIMVFAPMVVTPSDYRDVLREETHVASRYYAPSEIDGVLSRTNGLYRVLMVDSHLDDLLQRWFIPADRPSREISPGVNLPGSVANVADRLMDYWQGFALQVYLFLFRVAHLGLWVGYIVPFFCAIVYDGIMTRNIKLQTLAYTSPTVYNLSWHLIIVIVCASLVTFAVATPISIYFFPVCLSVIGLLARLVLGNVQHSA